MNKKLYYGAAYYPELWDEKTFREDLALMKEAGINVVRMGEFAWSTMEPHQDYFHVDHFVDIIKRFYENGIETIICTPTATPPIWVSHNHLERMLCDENGTKMSHGGRQQVCTNNAFFRERSKMIIERMAKVYGNLPGVIGWQLDNEFKGNVSECYCETCKGLWHQWLKNKYGTIEKLNHVWGTHIWSQHYEYFEQVPTPMKTPAGHSPSLMTAYRLFSRDLVVQFVNEQVDIIRSYSELPITHNSSLNHYIDNEKTFERLDVASFDHYSTSDDYNYMLSYCDVFKTLKENKPFWVMETSASFSGCVLGYQPVHKNGYIKAEAAAAYALGASGFSYWLWRQQRSGFEQTHGSVLHSWGKPTVGFKNVVEAGKLRDKLEKVLLKTIPAKAELAVTYSDKARAFFISEPLDGGFNYVEEMIKWHHMVLDTGIHSDFVFENGSVSDYKVLMTPFLPYVSEKYIQRALSLVDNGGIWVVGPLTGIRTGEHTIPVDHALGKLENLAGVETVYHYPMTGSDTYGIFKNFKATLSLWSSVFECISAKAVGFTEGGVTPNMPFITECERGRGKIVMLGAMPTGEEGTRLLRRLLTHYAEEAGLTLAADVTTGTIVVPRKGEGINQWVIVNMDGKGGEVTVPVGSVNAFTEEDIASRKVEVEPYGCEVIEY